MAEVRNEHARHAGNYGEGLIHSGGGLLASPGPFRPMVDFVARINTGVFTKLLSGFLVGALLLLGMGVLSLVVIARMSQRVEDLNLLQQEADLARQMIYGVTAQSHFRAMALVCEFVELPPSASLDDCTPDPPWNDRIASSKGKFLEHLDAVDEMSSAENDEFFDRVREANDRLAASSEKVLALYQGGEIEPAVSVHITEEHEVSHDLEEAMKQLIAKAREETAEATDAFESDRGFLRAMVGTFSGASLAVALLLGFVLSWLVVDPVRQMGLGMRRIASGDFVEPVEVANRDELGELATQINQTAVELARLQEETVADERSRALKERIAHVVTTQEEERRRISRELHDGLGPSLAAIGNRLRVCRAMLRTDPDGAESDLDDIAHGLTAHIQEIRSLIHDLRPVNLDQLGLVEALSQHVERFSRETGTSVAFSASDNIDLNPLAEVTVFRVVQECLGNIQRHAEASQVEVRLLTTAHGLEVTVSDDGRGFDPADVTSDATKQGMGLINMRERAEILNARLSVESRPGNGCHIRLSIPLKEA